MKKQRLEQLTNEMIKINIVELDRTNESASIEVTHKRNEAMNGLLKKVRPATSAEWYYHKGMSDDIVRDEVYAAMYEAMVIVSEDMPLEEISLDNKEFMGQVMNYALNIAKKNLIPASKKNRDGSIIQIHESSCSPLIESDSEAANSPLEDLLAGNISVDTEEEEERKNHFLKWFDNNKDFILTKKQSQFLDGEVHHKDPDKARTMRKRISERVSRAYSEQYGDVSPRIAVLMDQERILEEILDAKSFRAAYDKYKDEDFIIDATSEYVALEYLQSFNKGNNNPDTIRAMRIALYKKLGEIINMIEANK